MSAGIAEREERGGPAGDLYIFLSIKPHEFFQRDGADVFCKVPIAMTTAALGGQIEARSGGFYWGGGTAEEAPGGGAGPTGRAAGGSTGWASDALPPTCASMRPR